MKATSRDRFIEALRTMPNAKIRAGGEEWTYEDIASALEDPNFADEDDDDD